MELTTRPLSEFTELALTAPLGGIYPLSVTQGYQSGEVYELGSCAVIHHLCGFAFLLGQPRLAELEALYNNMLRERRFVLFCSDERQLEFFGNKADIALGPRCFFEYQGSVPAPADVPEGFEIKEIDLQNISLLDGRITPSFSWENTEQFLRYGKGYCVMCGETPAAWAFSAAVSDTEVDIGVETLEQFRGKGLAAAAANEMIRYVLSCGKKPVWACHSENIGSMRVAEKLGFTKIGECRTVIRQK